MYYDEYHHLIAMGESREQICIKLKVSWQTLERALYRAAKDRREEFSTGPRKLPPANNHYDPSWPRDERGWFLRRTA